MCRCAAIRRGRVKSIEFRNPVQQNADWGGPQAPEFTYHPLSAPRWEGSAEPDKKRHRSFSTLGTCFGGGWLVILSPSTAGCPVHASIKTFEYKSLAEHAGHRQPQWRRARMDQTGTWKGRFMRELPYERQLEFPIRPVTSMRQESCSGRGSCPGALRANQIECLIPLAQNSQAPQVE